MVVVSYQTLLHVLYNVTIIDQLSGGAIAGIVIGVIIVIVILVLIGIILLIILKKKISKFFYID